MKKYSGKNVDKSYVIDDLDIITELHQKIISTTGGEHGIRDYGGLYLSVYRILLSQTKSKSPFSLWSFAYIELARKHHFYDGNKRTAYVYANFMLILEEYGVVVYYKNALNLLIMAAENKGKVSKKQLTKWVAQNTVKIKKERIEIYLRELTIKPI